MDLYIVDVYHVSWWFLMYLHVIRNTYIRLYKPWFNSSSWNAWKSRMSLRCFFVFGPNFLWPSSLRVMCSTGYTCGQANSDLFGKRRATDHCHLCVVLSRQFIHKDFIWSSQTLFLDTSNMASKDDLDRINTSWTSAKSWEHVRTMCLRKVVDQWMWINVNYVCFFALLECRSVH
jgi:hypothetical protein